jgi:hypothetical protein
VFVPVYAMSGGTLIALAAVGMPLEVMELMKLYPQPVQRSGVEFLPIDVPTKRRGLSTHKALQALKTISLRG